VPDPAQRARGLVGAERGEGGQRADHEVADERPAPDLGLRQAAEAIAVRRRPAHQRPHDDDAEDEQQGERGQRRPPGQRGDEQRTGDGQLDQRQGDGHRRLQRLRGAEVGHRAPRPVAVDQLGCAGDDEDGCENELGQRNGYRHVLLHKR
jgi:hypothetical protein